MYDSRAGWRWEFKVNKIDKVNNKTVNIVVMYDSRARWRWD